MIHFTVPSAEKIPKTIKDLARSKGLSLTLWRKIKNAGTILVNNQPASPATLLKPGDEVTLLYTSETSIIPTELSINIIYEDEYLLIVDKPSGMLVHPTTDSRFHSLANAVMHYYHSHDNHYGFHPVLRLDKNTSGLVLIAKYPHIQHLFSNEENTIHKRYLAIVSGIPSIQDGLIDAPIARHPNSIIVRTVDSAGQKALTRYQVIRALREASLVNIELLTGRTHQIRVHFSYIGHPLLGDDLYGGPTSLIQRQALHAAELTFHHPVFKGTMEIKSSLPDDMEILLKSLS